MMSIEEMTGALGLGELDATLAAHWAGGAIRLMPDPALWLSDASVGDACAWLGIEPEIAEVCLACTRFIRNTPAALELAWLCHYVIFLCDIEESRRVARWPVPPESPLFHVPVLLAGLDHLRRRHLRRGIAESVTRQTLQDLPLWIHEHRRRFGTWGLSEVGWLVCHFTGRVYQLGRLQFEPTRFELDFHVLASREQAKVVTMAGEGMTFRADGQFDGANGVRDAVAWYACYASLEPAFVGYPIHPRGYAMRRSIQLNKGDWAPALQRGDEALFVHIPQRSQYNGPLTYEACADSFTRARAFFAEHFADHALRAFFSDTWLLDGQLADHLPAESNIVQFQRFFYLLPHPHASDGQTLERVFDGPVKDWSRAPSDTALRRAIIAHVRAGGRWRGGVGIRLLEQAEPAMDLCEPAPD